MTIPRCLSLLSLVLLAATSYAVTWTSIDYPGARNTNATGINSAGTIVGYWNENSAQQYSHGFLDVNGVLTSFDVPNGTFPFPAAINDFGQIVGSFFSNTDSNQHGFFFDGVNYQIVEPPGVTIDYSFLTGINNAGIMVGQYVTDTNVAQVFEYDSTTGIYTNLPPAPQNAALLPGGINNLNEVVGEAATLAQTGIGFRFSGGTYHFFTVPPASNTYPVAVNDSDEIVGYVYSPKGQHVGGFLLVRVNSLLFSYPGATFTQATGVNNAGSIVGKYVDVNSVGHGFLRTP
jgi:uncharacterized membrane protein